MRGLNDFATPWALAALLAGAQVCAHAEVLTTTGGDVTGLSAGVGTRPFPSYYLLHGENEDLQLVPDPKGANRQVFKVTLRNRTNDMAQRTEIIPYDEYRREGKRWYAFSILFPDPWPSTYDLTVFQLHTSQSISGWKVSPPISVVAVGTNLELRTNSSHLRPTKANKIIPPSNYSNNVEKQAILLETVRPNTWYCGVVLVDWNINAGLGSTRFWLNNRLAYSSDHVANNYESEHDPELYKNAAGNSVEAGNYPKAGLYASGYMTPGVNSVSVHHGFVYVGDNLNPDGSQASEETMRGKMAQLTMCPQ
jgi:hypothetical protein